MLTLPQKILKILYLDNDLSLIRAQVSFKYSNPPCGILSQLPGFGRVHIAKFTQSPDFLSQKLLRSLCDQLLHCATNGFILPQFLRFLVESLLIPRVSTAAHGSEQCWINSLHEKRDTFICCLLPDSFSEHFLFQKPVQASEPCCLSIRGGSCPPELRNPWIVRWLWRNPTACFGKPSKA